jgi:hypothetical protein
MTGKSAFTLVLLALLPAMAGAQTLEVFPKTLELESPTAGLVEASGEREFLDIRFDTRGLQGERWQLWIEVTAPPESMGVRLPPEILVWTARPPFINGILLPDRPVLVGQGPIDGRPVRGRLIWRVDESAPAAGDFRGSILLTLEVFP